MIKAGCLVFDTAVFRYFISKRYNSINVINILVEKKDEDLFSVALQVIQ